MHSSFYADPSGNVGFNLLAFQLEHTFLEVCVWMCQPRPMLFPGLSPKGSQFAPVGGSTPGISNCSSISVFLLQAGRTWRSLSWDSCTATPMWALPGPGHTPWTKADRPMPALTAGLRGEWCFTLTVHTKITSEGPVLVWSVHLLLKLPHSKTGSWSSHRKLTTREASNFGDPELLSPCHIPAE